MTMRARGSGPLPARHPALPAALQTHQTSPATPSCTLCVPPHCTKALMLSRACKMSVGMDMSASTHMQGPRSALGATSCAASSTTVLGMINSNPSQIHRGWTMSMQQSSRRRESNCSQRLTKHVAPVWTFLPLHSTPHAGGAFSAAAQHPCCEAA